MNYATILLFATSALAHFRAPFPGERNATNWGTQTIGPCGGANNAVLPRYEWNIDGSPVEITYHHKFGVGALYFCGNGDCTSGEDFNHLSYEPVHQTSGNFCIPAVKLPQQFNNINQTGVIQIVYASPAKEGDEPEYMYNCVDVVVSENGPLFDGQCSNSTDVYYDEQVADIENSSVVQLSQISSFSYLRAATASAASASASATTSSGMDMGGMDMGGMDMGGMDMSGMSMDMPGMSMTTTTASSSSPTSSSPSPASSASSVSQIASTTATGGAIRLAVSANFAAAAILALVM